MKKTALFCISSLGLGHATRTLAVIESYTDTHSVYIVCAGKALAYLKQALWGKEVTFYDVQDYPPLERGKGLAFYGYLVVDSLNTVLIIRKEKKFVEKLCKDIKPEFIFSDGRYGAHVKGIPSFILSHQISFVMPRGFEIFQLFADHFNYNTFKKFNHVFIPDYERDSDSLGGVLSHSKILKKLSHSFIGILSSIEKRNTAKNVDFLFAVSGYLEEHKESFIQSLVEGAKKLPGRKILVLGEPGKSQSVTIPEHNIEIIPSISGEARTDLYNRANFVISRSGYTTIMDLAELDISGYFIPTPGQTEQEYLARYLGNKKHFLVSDKTIDFTKLQLRDGIVPYKPLWKTKDSVLKIKDEISKSLVAK